MRATLMRRPLTDGAPLELKLQAIAPTPAPAPTTIIPIPKPSSAWFGRAPPSPTASMAAPPPATANPRTPTIAAPVFEPRGGGAAGTDCGSQGVGVVGRTIATTS